MVPVDRKTVTAAREGTAVPETGGPGTLRALLRGQRRQELVLVNPGPAQEVRKTEEFLASLGSGWSYSPE